MKIASIVLVILGCGLLLWLCTYSPKAAAIAPAVKAALSRDITQAPQISTNSTAKDIHGFIQYFKRKGYIVSKSEAVYGAGGTLKSFAFRATYPGAHATVEARVKEVRKGIFTAGGSTASISIPEYKTPVSRMLARLGEHTVLTL